MRPTRRRVLGGLGAAAMVGCAGDPMDPPAPPDGAAPAPLRPAEPGPWDAPGTLDEAAFPGSVLAGDATAEGVLLSVRTTEVALTLTVVVADGEDWVEHSVFPGLAADQGVVAFELCGLPSDTAFRYVYASVDGARRSRVGRFRTALGSTDFRQLVVGATSCFGSDDPAFPCLQGVPAEEVDLFLLLGDTVYADGAETLEDYRAEWQAVEQVESFRSLVASTSVVATWDDHEVGNNWTLGTPSFGQDLVTPEQVEAATLAFREAIPMRFGPGGSLWRVLSWGAVLDVIVLDSRGERGDQRIVSEEQLAWAAAAIRDSVAAFKLVLVSAHVTDHTAMMGTVQDDDRWQGYPDQRDVLLAAAEAAPGVLFVTGDMHYGALQRVGSVGGLGASIYEVAVGPCGSSLFLVQALLDLAPEPPAQYEIAIDDWSWTRMTLDPGRNEITVDFFDRDGSLRASQVLSVGPG